VVARSLFILTVLGVVGYLAKDHMPGHERLVEQPSSASVESDFLITTHEPATVTPAANVSLDVDGTEEVDLEAVFASSDNMDEATTMPDADAPQVAAIAPESKVSAKPKAPAEQPAAKPVESGTPTFYNSRPKGERQPLEPLPDVRPTPPEIRFGNFRPFNPIDNFILAKIQEHGAVPKKLCDDWDYARRTSLDLAGVSPTEADLAKFFDWPKRDRRARWVDFLLSRPQYADHWTIFWGDLLREQGRVRGTPNNSLKNYLHDSLYRNTPYNAWVTELLTAEGPADENPATAFVLRDRADADTLTVAVAQVFLGVQFQCAQCHNHPFEWWTQDNFKGMAAFWSGTRQRVHRTETYMRNGREYSRPVFEVVSRDEQARGIFMTGATSPKGKGRAALAELVTQRENPYFARAAVNRLWAKMMGVGLVNPVDNFSTLNPASHPELLDWLAVEFVENAYDLRHVLRLIANSRTYQQTSTDSLTPWARSRQMAAETTAPGALFDGMLLRRMSAEQVHDSILMATGRYDGTGGWNYKPAIEIDYPPNPRSFLRTMGCSDRDTFLARDPSGGIGQVLVLLNGQFLNNAVKLRANHPVQQWNQQGRGAGEIVDALFAQILSRKPNKHERKWALNYVAASGHPWAWEDVQWALFNTREFLFIR